MALIKSCIAQVSPAIPREVLYRRGVSVACVSARGIECLPRRVPGRAVAVSEGLLQSRASSVGGVRSVVGVGRVSWCPGVNGVGSVASQFSPRPAGPRQVLKCAMTRARQAASEIRFGRIRSRLAASAASKVGKASCRVALRCKCRVPVPAPEPRVATSRRRSSRQVALSCNGPGSSRRRPWIRVQVSGVCLVRC